MKVCRWFSGIVIAGITRCFIPNARGQFKIPIIFRTLLLSAVIICLCLPTGIKPTSALVDTMSGRIYAPATANAGNIIVSPSEVSVIAVGSDGQTFYAVDIANSRLYKSTNGGVTWGGEISFYLTLAGANLPVWNIAIAPDDVNFLVAVTDGTVFPSGPKKVFISQDSGANWYNTNFTGAPSENISCIDVSKQYSGKRDIAIGTRTGVGTGTVYVLKVPDTHGWRNQHWPGGGFPTSDVVALKFSPNYFLDGSYAVVYCTSNATLYNIGLRDINVNITSMMVFHYDIEVRPWTFYSSPGASEIVTADLELPSDFNGQTASKRRAYITVDTTLDGYPTGIYRIDNTTVYTPFISPSRISSIAYWGTYDSGKLLAGEVLGDASAATVGTWFTSSPTVCPITDWRSATTTGARGSGWGNAQVAWSPGGDKAYCGTSSANPTAGGTGWTAGQWPRAWLNGVALDESAFAFSCDDSQTWNSISLIDTSNQEVPDWRRNIRPGDILYNRVTFESVILNKLIIAVGHIGMYVNDVMDNGQNFYNQTVEARYPGVMHRDITTWDSSNRRNVYLLRVHCSDGIINNAITFVKNQLCKGYDFKMIQKRCSPNSNNWYCSELVWAAYYNQGTGINIEYNATNSQTPQGISLPGCVFIDAVTPSEIYQDTDTCVIGKHEEPGEPSNVFVLAICPVDFAVTDPNGHIISKENGEIPEAIYIEDDFNNDGSPDDLIYIPQVENGVYSICVVPEPDAELTDTYSLEVCINGTSLILAQNVQIKDIPKECYRVQVTGSGQVSVITGPLSLPAETPRVSPLLAHPPQLPPANVRLHNLSVSPSQARARQPVTVLANVVNNGASSGSYNVALRINGKVEQQRIIEVSPGAAYPVKFTVTKSQPGTYDVAIEGQKASFTILGASGTTGKPVNAGTIALIVMVVLILATAVVLMMTFRRPA